MQLPARFGKYVLLKELELGGMAAVYLAKAHGAGGFEKLLAIKRIFPQLSRSEDFVEMFIAEARIASELNHPNISHIYDLGQEEGDYFIAMEYIHGKDAFRLLKRCRQQGRRIPLELACYITQQVLQGLDYAHRKRDHANQPMGIVHRDVSPRNVLISYEGNVKLIDFGIAKAASQNSHTQAGTIKGKIHYMSPEQSLGKNLDGRSDLFSAGLLLYELIFQARLFKGDTDVHTLELIRECSLPDFRQKYPELPEAVDEILRKSLARDREQRFQSASQFIEALNRFLVQFNPMPGPPQVAELMSDVFGPEIVGEQRELEVFRSVRDDDTGRTRLSDPQLSLQASRSSAFGMVSGQIPAEALARAQDLSEGDLDPGVTRIEPPPVRDDAGGDEGSDAHPLSASQSSRISSVSVALKPSSAEPVAAATAPVATASTEPRVPAPMLGGTRAQKGPSWWVMGGIAVGVVALGGLFLSLSRTGTPPGEPVASPATALSAGAEPIPTLMPGVAAMPPPAAATEGAAAGAGSEAGAGAGSEAGAGAGAVVPPPSASASSASPSSSGAPPTSVSSAAPAVSTRSAPSTPVAKVVPPTSVSRPVSEPEVHAPAKPEPVVAAPATPVPAKPLPAPPAEVPAPAPVSPPVVVAPAPAPAPEPRATGFLNINSTMPCVVRVDGVVVGQTPLKSYKISVGKHKIELERLSDKATRSYDIDVKAQQVHPVLWRAGE